MIFEYFALIKYSDNINNNGIIVKLIAFSIRIIVMSFTICYL